MLEKCPTGVEGLDQVTGGGLPRGRPTLLCGGAGCGKTLLAMEFLVRGARDFGEPGVFMAFEETGAELAANVASLGFDVPRLIARKQLAIDFVRVERSEIEETGEYDLEGLFVRLGHAIDTVGAKRVVLDTIESLFSGLSNAAILRAELRRLFRWLKDRGVTFIVTGERGDGTLTRQGLEEYVSDCVILLDHRVDEQVSTRRLRIVKYRGSAHGTNEYPFLIDADGVSVLPITTLGLEHAASEERVSSGIPRLDAMLGGGLYRGSSVLISGTAGTGKSSLACSFSEAACRRGERVLYLAFEESPAQIVRNMRSIGLDLQRWVRAGRLHFTAARATSLGLEAHLVTIHRRVAEVRPQFVVVDPISTLLHAGTSLSAQALVTRLLDYLKSLQITALFTSLTSGGRALESTELNVSSLMDTWLLVRDIELGGERNRGLHIIKSRGSAHSNQVREFLITARGVKLLDVYLGPEGVLTGSARICQEARERAAEQLRRSEFNSRRRACERRRRVLLAQAAALRAELDRNSAERNHDQLEFELTATQRRKSRARMAASRRADELDSADARRGRQKERP